MTGWFMIQPVELTDPSNFNNYGWKKHKFVEGNVKKKCLRQSNVNIGLKKDIVKPKEEILSRNLMSRFYPQLIKVFGQK